MEETREPPLVVSFGPNGWFVRYANHAPLNHILPPTLHNKLSTRGDESSPVVALSMSADEVWFAKFEDGSTSWSGIFDNEGWDRLQELEHDVTLVAFAPGSGYLIHTDDGTAIYKGLPQQLAELLDAETERERKIKAKKENRGEWHTTVPPLRPKPSLSFIPQAPPTLARRLSHASMYGLLGQYQATPSGLFFMVPHAPTPAVVVSPTSSVASNSFDDHVDEPDIHEYKGRPIKFLSVSGSGGWYLEFDGPDSSEGNSIAWDGLPAALDKLLKTKLRSAHTLLHSNSNGSPDTSSRSPPRKMTSLASLKNRTVRVNAISFSPSMNGHYWVSFDDGSHFWVSSDPQFQKVLRNGPPAPGVDDSGYSSASTEPCAYSPFGDSDPVSGVVFDRRGSFPTHLESSLFNGASATAQSKRLTPGSATGSLRTQLRPVPEGLFSSGTNSPSPINSPTGFSPPRSSMVSPDGSCLATPPPTPTPPQKQREVRVDPKRLMHTQDLLSSEFSDGSSIFFLFTDLSRGVVQAEDVPRVRMFMDPRDDHDEEENEEEEEDGGSTEGSEKSVVRTSSDGSLLVSPSTRLWCLDNRRLWVFNKAGLKSIPVLLVEPPPDFLQWVCTPFCGFSLERV
ncbi:hypothetical protein BJ742DRAFT_782987 [Cladochytrium replicatum]|nr:hypothetical protein BJ742DRAFT_782987 [Cladochytrium replicatum]